MVFVVCLLKTNCQHNKISLDAISDELQNRTEDCRIEAFQCSKWRVPANSAMEDTEGDGDVILAPHTIPSSDRNRSRWWWERKARVLSKEAAEGFDERRRDRLASIGAVQLCNEGRLSQQVVHEAQVVQQSTI